MNACAFVIYLMHRGDREFTLQQGDRLRGCQLLRRFHFLPADAGCSNDFSCTSGSSCQQVSMELASHSGKCTGAGACKGASISSELEPSFAGPSQLHCSAAGACSNAKISLPLQALSRLQSQCSRRGAG